MNFSKKVTTLKKNNYTSKVQIAVYKVYALTKQGTISFN